MNEKEFEFGRLVKRARTEKDLTLQELSEKTKGEITASYINRLETGKKSNPSFDVVAELCKALDLDMREVFQSFGFGALIKDFNQDAVFTIEEVFRLHKIRLSDILGNQKDYAIGESLLQKKEKEQLIKIINTIFEYSFADETDAIEKLTSAIKQIYLLREMEKEDVFHKETFNIQYMDVTYTIECDPVIKKKILNLKEWKESIGETINKYGNLLADFSTGILTLPVGNQEWVLQKEENVIKPLFKKSDIVSL